MMKVLLTWVLHLIVHGHGVKAFQMLLGDRTGY